MDTSNKKKVLLIDANNMFFRAYTASPALGTKGNHVGGITGFLYSLQKSIKDINPHKVFIVWDGRGGSKKRREIREDYKDGRKPPKPLKLNRAHDIQHSEEDEKQSLYYQQSRVIQLMNSFPYMQICEPGVEADDCISYLSHKFGCQDNNLKIIVSNDKDFIQLTDECTILYRPATQQYVTYKSFVTEEGIHPKNMALARAIEGDKADNLSGVYRVGRKTLAKKYPELSENKFLSLDEFRKLLEDKKDCKTSQAILSEYTIVKQNYEIMQLYAPLVPANTALDLNRNIQDYTPIFSPDSIKSFLSEEGIVGISLGVMFEHSYKIIKEKWYDRS